MGSHSVEFMLSPIDLEGFANSLLLPQSANGTFCWLQTILGEFNKEQDAFINGKQKSMEAAVPPWVGYPNEEKLKEEILSLSQVGAVHCISLDHYTVAYYTGSIV